jgi:E3 ubiquitin-protein ligase listerin
LSCGNESSGTVYKSTSSRNPFSFSYISKYLSEDIIREELETIHSAIRKHEFDEENLEIRVNRVTKEISTRYQIEEGEKNEIIIRLPPSYPLAEVEIVGSSRVGVNQERWNKWLLMCKIACKVPNR